MAAKPDHLNSLARSEAPTGAVTAPAWRNTRGVVSQPSGLEVTAQLHAPPRDLADVVEVFWVGRWDIPQGKHHVNELLGDPCMHIAFEQCLDFVEARLVGVWTKLWRRTLRERGFVRAAKLRTGTALEWWDAPAMTFTNRITPLEAVVGPAAFTLRQQVLEPERDEDGLAALAEWLRAHRRPHRSPDAQLVGALAERVRSQPELTRAEELAHVAGVGLRALQHLFRTHVGASPKWFIRRCRLQEVATQLGNHTDVHLAQLAARLGYADQSHLTRDFKAATGRTPRQFVCDVRNGAHRDEAADRVRDAT